MKLMIQIPCFNERDQLEATVRDLPRRIPGVDVIEVLIIDDGSTDGTSEVAEQLGVHHIVRFPRNRGLAAAYVAGVDACFKLGADIIVNTDADNQYCAADVPALIEPILSERADVVIGDRQIKTLYDFSALKRWLQRLGSWVTRQGSGLDVHDATSGFRAISREAASSLFVHNKFTYTIETLLQSGHRGLAVENVPVRTHPKSRESRLFRSIPNYVRRSIPVILHSYLLYWPLKVFGWLTFVLFLVGTLLIGRFLFYYFQAPGVSGHLQSLMVGVGSVILSFLVGLFAMLSHLIASNRRLLEDLLARMRHLDAHIFEETERQLNECIYHTGAPPWYTAKGIEDDQLFDFARRTIPQPK